MRELRNSMCLVCLGFCLLLEPVLAGVVQSPVNDVRILMDVSGSMKKNDPDKFRTSGLRMLSELLPIGTRAGVWTFGRYVNMQVKLGIVDEQWKKAAAIGAEALHSRGLFTNIEAAIKTATRDWREADPAYQRSLILLTDGVVDVSKNPDESAASRQRILQQQIARLGALGVKVYAIALSFDADTELLSTLADETQGWYEMAESSERLQRIFLRMFEKTVQADTLPLVENKFVVDSSVQELTLLVFKQADAGGVQLLLPGNESTVSIDNNPDGFKWLSDTTYEMITVENPSLGEWQIIGATDPDNRVMIATDLNLRVGELPNQVLPDNALLVSAVLQQAGEIITRNDFLDLVSMKLTVQSKNATETYQLLNRRTPEENTENNGLFSAQLMQLGEGVHTLEIEVDGKTFSRTYRHVLEVQWPVVVELHKHYENINGSHLLVIKPRSEIIDIKSVLLDVWLQKKESSSVVLQPHKQDVDEWLVSIDTRDQTTKSEIFINITGRAMHGGRIDQLLAPIIVPGGKTPVLSVPEVTVTQVSEKTDWIMIGAIASGVAIVCLLLFIIGWIIMGKRKRMENIGDDEEDEENEEDEEGEENEDEGEEDEDEKEEGDKEENKVNGAGDENEQGSTDQVDDNGEERQKLAPIDSENYNDYKGAKQ